MLSIERIGEPIRLPRGVRFSPPLAVSSATKSRCKPCATEVVTVLRRSIRCWFLPLFRCRSGTVLHCRDMMMMMTQTCHVVPPDPVAAVLSPDGVGGCPFQRKKRGRWTSRKNPTTTLEAHPKSYTKPAPPPGSTDGIPPIERLGESRPGTQRIMAPMRHVSAITQESEAARNSTHTRAERSQRNQCSADAPKNPYISRCLLDPWGGRKVDRSRPTPRRQVIGEIQWALELHDIDVGQV